MNKAIRFVKALIYFSRLDNHLHVKEREFIVQFAKEQGINEEQLNEYWEEQFLVDPAVDFSIIERFILLRQLIPLMLLDGEIHADELDYARNLASHVGFDETLVDTLITIQKRENEPGLDVDKLRAKMDHAFLNDLLK